MFVEGGGAEARSVPEETAEGAGREPSSSAREKGTRGTKRPGQRKRKHKDVTRGGSDGDVES